MSDHAFWRRREIERMLLSGRKLTVPDLMAYYGASRNAIRRDLEIVGEELPVITKQGYDGGFYLMAGVGLYQNALSKAQLECLEKLSDACPEERETIQSIIKEFGPYQGMTK